MVLLTFGGFGGWAATAPLASAVVADGVLKVASERKAIEHPDGGVVREILVKDGELVHKGQPLVRLDDVKARAVLQGLRHPYAAARARQARLEAEMHGDPSITFPEDLVERRDQEASVAQLLENEQAVFSTRRTRVGGAVSILRQKTVQLEKQVEGEKAQLLAVDKQMKIAREELSGFRKLFEKGIVEKSRVIELEREIARLEGAAGHHVAESARLETQIAEMQLEVIQKDSAFKEEVAAEMSEVDKQISDFESKITDAAHTTLNTAVTAPEDGVAMGLTVHSIGEVIKPGETILELIPKGEPLVVEVRLSPRDVEDLRPGQRATVRLTAFRQRVTPSVDGSLVYLSADRLTDERTQQSYYVARIAVPPGSLEVLGGRTLQPGMPAEVVIESGERTVLAYLAQPILDGLSRTWREK